ncbi:MAG: formate dehydrogenase accessory protein FdhE [Candidatus Accumulibacter sp.]|jgi:FdhE protein|nr:formate dehydrogenase accessory protein FdhE [Accumulibacter sp.]
MDSMALPEIRAAAPPGILLPDPETLFAARRARFAALAPGHPLGDWLACLGHLTQIQHDLLQTFGAALREAARSAETAAPPLDAAEFPRPAAWREITRRLAREFMAASPEAMRERLTALQTTPDETLEVMAAALLDGRPAAHALPEHVIVGAGLQVVWTALAARLDANRLGPLAERGGRGGKGERNEKDSCPCCGSAPVGSVVGTSAQIDNLRYLHCSLCNTEWNLPRAVCAACASDEAVSYRHIAQCGDAVRAECCDRCRSYLKVMMREKAPDIDPVADDLASLALDVLLDEAGYARSGPNLLLLCAPAR